MKLKYEWSLDAFLQLRQVVEIREALETARYKDHELEMNKPKNKL